jgi:hypothetical protein
MRILDGEIGVIKEAFSCTIDCGNGQNRAGSITGVGTGPYQKGYIMKIFIWRHSKLFSSWSMFDEPHVFRDNYLQAEIIVLANSESEALELIRTEERWHVEELKRIVPRVLPLDKPAVVGKLVQY